jgi:hypothetical protein
MGIPPNYANEAHPAEQIEKWHREREGVMMKKIMEKKGDAERSLLFADFSICNR